MTEEGPRRRRYLLAIGAVAVLLLAGGAATLLPGRADTVRVARVERKPLRVKVSCAGLLVPPPGGELHAPEAGLVEALLVADGTPVVKGQPLLTIGVPDLASQVLQAQAEVALLQADAAALRLERAQALEVAAARKRVAEADTRLVVAGALPAATAEASALALTEADTRLAGVQARLARLEEDPGSRLGLARARARALAAQAEALTVRAPADGVAFGLPRRIGEAVTAGQIVAAVALADTPQVRLSVDQPDLARVAADQSIVATFDGRPERRWTGRVRSVARSLRPAEGRDVADVHAEIADPEHLLPLNARVDVEVLVGERPDALVAPRAALQREGEKRYVLVLVQGRAVRRDVTCGLVGPADVEVLSGLAEGETVIVPGVAQIETGQRVSAGR